MQAELSSQFTPILDVMTEISTIYRRHKSVLINLNKKGGYISEVYYNLQRSYLVLNDKQPLT